MPRPKSAEAKRIRNDYLRKTGSGSTDAAGKKNARKKTKSRPKTAVAKPRARPKTAVAKPKDTWFTSEESANPKTGWGNFQTDAELKAILADRKKRRQQNAKGGPFTGIKEATQIRPGKMIGPSSHASSPTGSRQNLSSLGRGKGAVDNWGRKSVADRKRALSTSPKGRNIPRKKKKKK